MAGTRYTSLQAGYRSEARLEGQEEIRKDYLSRPGDPAPPLRPASRAWLKEPGYIDGALHEPQFYYNDEELHACHEAAVAAAGLLALQKSGAPTSDRRAPSPSGSPTQSHGSLARSDSPASHACNLSPSRDPSIPPHPSSSGREGAAVAVQVPVPSASIQGTTGSLLTQAAPSADSSRGAEYLLQVQMNYIETVRGAPARGSKVQTKAQHINKMVYAVLKDVARTDFVHLFLGAHNLNDQYAAGPHSGPIFKLWWTGVPKGNATTVERDSDFAVALRSILNKRGCAAVNVEFDMDALAGFHVQAKRPFPGHHVPATDGDDELVHGTTVPQLSSYPDKTQLHGSIILELKRLHKCTYHVNEQNAPGACYKPEGGGMNSHVRLNNLRLKAWAAAIAAGDATKRVPPNSDEFDGTRGSEHIAVMGGSRARGRHGPSSPFDPSMMMLGYFPWMAALAANQQMAATAGMAPIAHSATHPPQTPRHSHHQSPPSSPMPPRGSELHHFLVALDTKKNVNMLAYEEQLMALDFTPDILPEVPVSRLKEITGAVDGTVMKMQLFAKEWVARQVEKRMA